ncbi:MAG: ThuA domain-containing protein [Opitutaceae bacterium]|nr:ThuA domain-containing protein [Opitutaceae bacterium]
MKFRALVIVALASLTTLASAADRKLVMIAGPVSHPPLMHEFRAGSMLLQKRLQGFPGLKTVLVTNGWPTKMVDGKRVDDNSIFDEADAIFIYSDGGANHLAVRPERLEFLRGQVKKGVSLGCAHYAVEVVPDKGGPEWKEWIGGHYENSFSCNPIWEADFQTLPVHPITRGVKPFKTKDEWYFNMRFRDGKAGVKDILVAKPSDAVRDGPYVHPKGPYPHIQAAKGRPETMMWAVERPDGGRGFGFTGGHFHLNWQNDDQRRLILNALVWLAKLEVPAAGVNSAPVSDVEIMQNLDEKKPAAPKKAAPKS